VLLTTVLTPLPSITTLIVVPIFSNLAIATAGKLIVSALGATSIVEVLVTSIGDCLVLIAHAAFSGASEA